MFRNWIGLTVKAFRCWMFAAAIGFLGLVTGCFAETAGPSDLHPVTMHPAPTHAPVVIVSEGKAAKVVVRSGASAALTNAAEDLIKSIHESTGVLLEKAKTPGDGPAIMIGDSEEAAAAGLSGAKMPIEGFTIKTTANRVFIVGNDLPIAGLAGTASEGSAWGVNDFCERFVGVRWYWPNDRPTQSNATPQAIGTSIPKLKQLVIDPVWLSDAPVFRKRDNYPGGGPAIGNADIASHNRRMRSVDTWPTRLRVHAPHDWSGLFQQSRPEIFQRRSDGERDFSMLCYGNPKTLETYLEQIEFQIKPDSKVNPATQIVDGNNITVSPNDLSVACTCDDCKKLWNPDGGQYGTASLILGTFVQKLAVEVKKRWPEKTIIYLPYKNYTAAPAPETGVKFPRNVEVQICGMPGLAQYKEPGINESEQATIDAWIKISGRKILNWHYNCWPEDRSEAAYHYPHVIQAHYRANRDKTIGSFINGEMNHWPRQNISMYVWLKALWNPELNVDAVMDEYARRMFGAAAAEMRELLRMQVDGWEKSRWPGGQLSVAGIYENSYPRADVVKMESLLAASIEKTKDDALTTQRIEYVARPIRAFFAESRDFAEGTGRTTIDVEQVPEEPVIDGKLEDACWQKNKPVFLIRALDKNNPKAKFPTQVQAVWSRQGVTFGFKMTEPDPTKLARDIGVEGRDSALMWWNDNIEIFLDVEGKRTDHYQFIVNPNGAVWDGHRKDNSWNAKNIRTAGFVGADYWSLEVFIPYTSFNPVPRPNTGTIWYGNITRHRVGDRTEREVQRLNTTFAGPSNNESAFGPIRFIEK